MLRVVQGTLQISEKISPVLAARMSVALASRPRKHMRKPREQEQLAQASRIEFTGAQGKPCVAWSWGQGPVVLVAHGWESRGSQMATMAMAIAEAGFQAVAIDFTAHGDSAGSSVNFRHFAEDIVLLSRQFDHVYGFVGHSAGGVLSMAARELGFKAERYAVIGSPPAPVPAIAAIRKLLKVSEATVEQCQQVFASQMGVSSWQELMQGRAFANPDGQLLLIFDKDDREVDHHYGDQIARWWPGSVLIKTEGLGHRRLMWDDQVIKHVVDYLR